ncbi:MAG: protein tyrosine phosphatase family protein [Acidobacteriota bacterium]
MKQFLLLTAALASLGALSAANPQQESTKLDKIQQALKDDVPRILCVDERVATGGQPTDAAFAKLAANGYRAVLNLRTASEGIDLKHEQEAVEKAGMRYVNVPIVSSAPKPEQVGEFIKAVKDKDNQPMLIHCGSANRVGAFWMIYRVVDQGWPEDKALEEATKIGLTSPVLKKFAHDYIVAHQPKKTFSD